MKAIITEVLFCISAEAIEGAQQRRREEAGCTDEFLAENPDAKLADVFRVWSATTGKRMGGTRCQG